MATVPADQWSDLGSHITLGGAPSTSQPYPYVKTFGNVIKPIICIHRWYLIMDFHDFSSFFGKSGKLTEHPPKSYASRTTAWWPRSTSATTRSSAWLLDRSEGFIIWKFIEKCTCTYNFIQTLSDYQTFRKIIRYRGDREIRVRRNVARVPGLFECSEAPLRFGGLSVGEIGTPKISCS